jgi:hypothetical protein
MRDGRSRSSSLFAIGLLSCLVLGCNLARNLTSQKSLFEGTAMKEAAAAFKGKVGGPVKALSVEIEKDSATLKAQDPNNRANVDEYSYVRGVVLGPTPVRLNSLERNLDSTLFDLDEVNWDATEALARQAVERTRLDGGRVKKMTVGRGLTIGKDVSNSGAVSWTVEVDGTRESASAYADAKGDIRGLDLSQTSRAAQFTTYSADTLREAGPRIREAFGGDVKLLELIVNNKYIWFTALDPKGHKDINQYRYDINGVTIDTLQSSINPLPAWVQIARTRGHKTEDFIFDLGEVNLETAPDLGRKACERLGLTGGEVTNYTVSREPITMSGTDTVLKWDIHCKAGRRSGFVDYGMDGKELRVINPS